MIRFGTGGAVLAAFALWGTSAAAQRYVVIDNSQNFTACAYAASGCTPISTVTAPGSLNAASVIEPPINFTLGYGNGQQTNLYVYGSGLISIGSQLSSGPSSSSLASLGADVVTPLYGSSVVIDPTSFTFSTGVDNNGGAFQGDQFLRINYAVTYSGQATAVPVQADFYSTGGVGNFVLQFGYGNPFNPPAPVLPSDATIGFDLNGTLYQTTAGAARSQNDPLSFSFVNGRLAGPTPTPGVPEPATWAQMLAGVVVLGFALRRRGWGASSTARAAVA